MKIRRHVAVTALLVVYALFMTIYFGIDLLRTGQSGRFFITIGAEALVVTLAYFALRKRDILRDQQREQNRRK